MANNSITSAILIRALELLSDTVLAIVETENAAKTVLVQKENFEKFSTYLKRVIVVLRELSKLDIRSPDSVSNALEVINKKIKVAKQLASYCCNRNKVYLFLNSRRIVRHLEDITKEINRALEFISSASLDGSSVVYEDISKPCKNMLDNEYRVTTEEEQILEMIERGIEERNMDRSYANNLVICIAKAAGISTEQPELKREFEALKSEMDNDEMMEDVTEALRMEQIIMLLSKADMITTPEEKEMKYLNKRISLGRQPLEPLQSFYCPITGDIMVDPVETSSGKTFERSAIEKWLADGNNLCPLTMTPLNMSLLRSNRTLRRSIEEWKDRNTMIVISSMKPKIQSNEQQEVLHSLRKLQDLCIERELHQEWIVMEDYMPILIDLLGSKNHEIRELALNILFILAKDNNDNKERIAKVDNAIEVIACSLARKANESKLSLQLLLQLSENSTIQNIIGSVRGCILLLVTIASSDDTRAAKDADQLLKNLSFDVQNVIGMAKANYFGPLLHLLSSGSESDKMMMAKTLSEIELMDHSKLSLCKYGAQGPLLQLLSHEDIEMKKVAVKALRNLSNLPQNGLQMIKEGAMRPMFELLYHHKLSSPSLRADVAATILQLAKSSTAPEADQVELRIFESEENIFKLFSLISLTGPDVQQSILQIFISLSLSSSGPEIRATLTQISATRVLVQLCELEPCTVRANAVKLFSLLIADGENNTFLDHMDKRFIETLLRIVETSDNVEEIAAAMGIISNFPENSQINQWLLDAGALRAILACLASRNSHALNKREVVENAAGALCRFTVPTNQQSQKIVAEACFIPVLVDLLVSGSANAKRNVAISLKQLSESSSALSRPAKKRVAFRCCMVSSEACCPVHSGVCTLVSSFCLLEADAVRPLVRVLEEQDIGACEASLDALLTLIDGEQLQGGSKVLAEANGIVPIIKLLSSSSPSLQEKALKALERIFRLAEFSQKYAKSAQLPLVDITQRGSSSMKSLAAKTLAHLNVLHEQSSYF